MSTGIEETAKRIQAEAPESLEEPPNGLVSKVGQMLDMDDESLRMLDGIMNTSMFFGAVGVGMEALAGAGDVLTAGNADLLGGLGDAMQNTFGSAPNAAINFTPNGGLAPVPGAAPQVAAAPSAAGPTNLPGMKGPGLNGPGFA